MMFLKKWPLSNIDLLGIDDVWSMSIVLLDNLFVITLEIIL